ncbi:MAG: hypothetical protein LBS35_08970 [Synergistaceae bacterium]|jgi:hypothetical protein|nr:hypothetical protein [Synergistaceae bacterium]
MKRSGWFSPWLAGWINLKAMLLYVPDFFFLKPGLVFFIVGLIVTLLGGTETTIGKFSFRLHWMLLGISTTFIGVSALQIGIIGRLWHGYDRIFESQLGKIFSYNKGILSSAFLVLIGIICLLPALSSYIAAGFSLLGVQYLFVFGFFLIMLGFEVFGFTLLCELAMKRKR